MYTKSITTTCLFVVVVVVVVVVVFKCTTPFIKQEKKGAENTGPSQSYKALVSVSLTTLLKRLVATSNSLRNPSSLPNILHHFLATMVAC